MRPVRLEMEGFMAFRERTVVDLAGVELFALTGPTGAGKSSVIDAMIFALYGTIPRLADDRLVGAVVSQGRPEGRVRLDFDLGGQRWSAVRVVRVRDGKATTKEARLERGGEVVAGSAKDLEVEVTALLGLSATQFTTCVVLPQGQFARFLQAKPADRQDLLVRLLELGLYDTLRDAAGLRAGRLDGELAALRLRLEALGTATPEAIAATQEQLVGLDTLLAAVEAALPDLDAADRRREDLVRAVEQLRHQGRLLAEVKIPAGVDTLAERVEEVRALVVDADQAEVVAVAALTEAEAGREAARERAPLEAWLAAHEEQPAVEAACRAGHAGLADASARHAAAAAAIETSAAAARAAEAEYERTVADNRAAALRARLSLGEACPVCDQVVLTIPDHEDPAEVGAALQARDRAAAEEAAADRAAQTLAVAAARAQERAEQADAQSKRLTARLADAPDRDQVVARLAVVDAAQRRVQEARTAREQAAVARRRAGEAAAAATEAEQGAWAAFDRERDTIGPLGPPAADRASLSVAWAVLTAWAVERKITVARDEAALAADVSTVEAERGAVVGALDRLVADAGLAVGERSHRDVAMEARVRTEHALSVLEDGLAERLRLGETEVVLRRDAQVAMALKQELHANRFEKWVLDQVLRDLCTAATALLQRLSQHAYSLALDDRAGFVVVDHRSADETRPTRTLSGGETFLVSLALALALAEQVAQAGPQRGAAHLESLFLDEGFGTLDLATLDVVAAAIEDLGAAGRMVGLVSHVPELAERVPVRFAVQRGPRSSTIERVDQ